MSSRRIKLKTHGSNPIRHEEKKAGLFFKEKCGGFYLTTAGIRGACDVVNIGERCNVYIQCKVSRVNSPEEIKRLLEHAEFRHAMKGKPAVAVIWLAEGDKVAFQVVECFGIQRSELPF